MSNQKVVRISNALVRCVQQLKVSDKRLLMLLISNSNNANIDGLITATAKDYASVYGVSTSCAYKEMPVSHARIRALEFDVDGVSSNWFISRLTTPIEGQVDVRIHPDIKHHMNPSGQKNV